MSYGWALAASISRYYTDFVSNQYTGLHQYAGREKRVTRSEYAVNPEVRCERRPRFFLTLRVFSSLPLFVFWFAPALTPGGHQPFGQRSDGPRGSNPVGVPAAQRLPVRPRSRRQPGNRSGSREAPHGGAGDEEHDAGGALRVKSL